MRWPFLAGFLSLLASAVLAQPSSISTPAGRQLTLPGPVPLGNGPSLDLNFANGSAFDARIAYTGSGGTFFNAAGAIVAATTNVPRIDYDPVTHAVRGLLIEEARTNLLLNSATLVTQSVTTTAIAYTMSFYSTGSVALSGSCAGSPAGTGAFPARVALTFTATAGTCTVTVTGSVLNANLEAGSFATSWIATAGASSARAQDYANMPLGAMLATGTASIAMDYSLLVNPPNALARLASLSDGTVNNLFEWFVSGTSMVTNVASGGSSGGPSILIAQSGKLAASERNGAQSMVLNGGAPTTTSLAISPTLTQLTLGNRFDGARPMSVWIRRFRIWPRVITTSELQSGST